MTINQIKLIIIIIIIKNNNNNNNENNNKYGLGMISTLCKIKFFVLNLIFFEEEEEGAVWIKKSKLNLN